MKTTDCVDRRYSTSWLTFVSQRGRRIRRIAVKADVLDGKRPRRNLTRFNIGRLNPNCV